MMECGCKCAYDGDLMVKKGCKIHDTSPRTPYNMLVPSKVYIE